MNVTTPSATSTPRTATGGASSSWFERKARKPGYSGTTQTADSGVASPRVNEVATRLGSGG
jgi:hypothetical protein